MSKFKVGDTVEIVSTLESEAASWLRGHPKITKGIIERQPYEDGKYILVTFKERNESILWWVEKNCLSVYSPLSPEELALEKQQKLLKKIGKLYKKYPSTSHWEMKNV